MIADCPPITWSIDTTGVSHPGRSSIAAREALRQWSVLTGIDTVYQPTGGQVSIVFRAVDSRWFAYALGNAIVISPAVANATAEFQQSIIAHEFGHILRIDHQAAPDMLMGTDGWMTRVTPADAALARCPT